MLGLPKSTELNKQLPKKAIYAKFQMNTATKDKFDADISRINIVAEISPKTTGIAIGESVSSIFVLLVVLKRKEFLPNTVALISKLIDQNMLLVLEYGNEQKLAIYHSKLIQTEWSSFESHTITLKGLDLDAVWENLVIQIGGITIQQGNTLDEQIASDEQHAKIEKEIARLEKLARSEKQPKKKFEIAEKIAILRTEGAK